MNFSFFTFHVSSLQIRVSFSNRFKSPPPTCNVTLLRSAMRSPIDKAALKPPPFKTPSPPKKMSHDKSPRKRKSPTPKKVAMEKTGNPESINQKLLSSFTPNLGEPNQRKTPPKRDTDQAQTPQKRDTAKASEVVRMPPEGRENQMSRETAQQINFIKSPEAQAMTSYLEENPSSIRTWKKMHEVWPLTHFLRCFFVINQ